MTDEYLWSGTGAPDPEIARLERLLARYKDRGRGSKARRFWPAIAIAASLLVGGVWATHRGSTDWKLVMDGSRPQIVKEGQTVETSPTGTATLDATSTGELTLEGNSKLTIERSHLALSKGTMHAFIWAPPAKFLVETPSAMTIDLGCSYTLHVASDGSGILRVDQGWVAFQSGTLESFIPEGAACRTRPGKGPGVPFFEDASERFRDSLTAFEASDGRLGLSDMLVAARERDALTLWHLLVRTRGHERNLVAVRFAELVPNVAPAALSTGDHAALDAGWNALGFGGTDWWRTWKQKW